MTLESPDMADMDRFVREELPRLVDLVEGSRVRELEIEDSQFGILLRRAQPDEGAVTPTPSSMESDVQASPEAIHHRTHQVISASMVGTFYLSEQPGRAPLVSEGDRVEPGNLIGVIEALQVLTEVESSSSGIVTKILAADGEPVEFGQPLVEVLVDS